MPRLLHNGNPIGEIKRYYGGTLPSGFLLCDGSTIGSAASGATGLASAYALDLFTQIWNSVGNGNAPIQDSTGAATTRGVSAAADFAANKRLPLPDSRGRALIGTGTYTDTPSGTGGTPTVITRTIGDKVGAANHILSTGELATHDHGGGSHTHNFSINYNAGGLGGPQGNTPNSGGATFGSTTTGPNGTVIAPVGSNNPHNNMQPSLAVTAMIRY